MPFLGSLFALACATTDPSSGAMWQSPQSSPSRPAPGPRERALLEAHNRLRAKHCAPPLRWSPEVAESARRWAESLARRGCVLDHSRGRYGENLAVATTGSLSAAEVAGLWYAEVKHYRFGRSGFSMQTGHFTQLVWVGTQDLGCGVAQCEGEEVWVCQYDPPGNVEGRFEKNVLPTTCRR